MFSRNNRLDYQVFFHTRGAVRYLGWKGLVVIVILSNVLSYLLVISKKHAHAPSAFGYPRDEILEMRKFVIGMLILTAALGRLLSSGVLKLLVNTPLRRAISLCSPLAAVLLLAPSIQYSRGQDFLNDEVAFRYTMVKWSVFTVLFLAVLHLTICRLRFRRVTELADCDHRKQRFVRRLITNVCMLVALVMVVLMYLDPIYVGFMLGYLVYSIVAVSFGNMQIPAAVLRVVLALVGLTQQDNDYADGNTEDKINLAPSLNIFYVMVLGQGILYHVAYVIYIFSFIPRRSLARHGGFRGQWGMESVNLYHGYVLEKCMESDVLAPKKISLASFAMDSLNSDSPKMQLHGIQLMHNLLQMEAAKTRLLAARITTCAKTLARLISMLDRTNARDAAAIVFAAKVTAELAKRLRVVTMPGIIQIVSTLLDDYGNSQRRRGNPLMDTDDEQEAMHGPVLNASGSQEERRIAVTDTSNLLETQGCSGQQFGEEEEPQTDTDQDLLPALGMSILYNLAGCDQSNCEEINKATGLVPKIIGFTSYSRGETASAGTQGIFALVASSLQLLHRLTSLDGEIGIKLRHKVSKHAFLLQNLANILQDSMSSQETRKLVAGILRNLAVDVKTRQEIGCTRLIVMRLTQEFRQPSTSGTIAADHLLRKVSGQALAMLAMESVHNCSVILEEAGHEFIKELTTMIHDGRYRCVAASLLRNMCLHARHKLNESDLQALSYSVREVLERIMDAKGAELEILIGLSSQMCEVIPEGFARELEHGYIKDRFIRRLAHALKMNMEPSAHCPGIRRAILGQVISMVEHDSGYVSSFNSCGMAEAVSMVEETASKAENYLIFLGDAGLMEHREPLSSLVVRAKQFLNAGLIPQPSSST